MPFINEKLAANQNSIDQAALTKTPSRQSRFLFDPDSVMKTLRSRIVGQEKVLSALEDMLYLTKADFGVAQRPLAVNFFLGPTGVGKTETVNVLAESLLGSRDKLCRIDMNTLAQEHYAAALTGAPPGYVGSKEGHTLFDPELIQGSFSKPGIVLFDEIEKASTEVIRALLNILDSGHLVLSGGTRSIDFSNTLIFMTSNVGAKELTQYRKQYQTGWRQWLGLGLGLGLGKELQPRKESEVLLRCLQKKFDPEFLNRIDNILSYASLNKEWIDSIVTIEIDKLNHRLARKNTHVIVDTTARSQLYADYDKEYGARHLARQIRVKLEPLLARSMMDHHNTESFIIQYTNHCFSISPQSS